MQYIRNAVHQLHPSKRLEYFQRLFGIIVAAVQDHAPGDRPLILVGNVAGLVHEETVQDLILENRSDEGTSLLGDNPPLGTGNVPDGDKRQIQIQQYIVQHLVPPGGLTQADPLVFPASVSQSVDVDLDVVKAILTCPIG